ncbi:MAG: HPP family protein [Leptolyngbya foveolarum]|uniref:HPP family protein n=1 Tax=Leptolyngbya foveolarum TaxID=47253 RepID=A0A2W4TPJ6_9CYAN|nr:MAG: HPP family protein [Leptolyngbya foveolarum]
MQSSNQALVGSRPVRPKRRRGVRRWRKILNRKLDACQPKFSLQHMLLSWLGAFIGIAALAYLTASTPYPLIAAPFGATAVLVFGVPDSPLAQPRNIIGGNLIAATICVICVALWGTAPWVMAIAVATTIKLTQLTRTVHPPAGAVALLGVLGNASWSYILTPVLIGSVVMVIFTVLFSHAAPGRNYPRHWI